MQPNNFNNKDGYTRGINLQAESAVEITKSDDTTYVPSSLFVGSGGNVRIVDASGNTATFTNLADGSILPVLVTKVFATDTTADGLIILN